MKKKLGILFIMFVILTFPTLDTKAENVSKKITEDKQADVLFGFDGNKTKIPEETIKPTVYLPDTKPQVSNLLPKTNELLHTLVFLLIGLSVLMVVTGLYLFKKTYENKCFKII